MQGSIPVRPNKVFFFFADTLGLAVRPNQPACCRGFLSRDKNNRKVKLNFGLHLVPTVSSFVCVNSHETSKDFHQVSFNEVSIQFAHSTARPHTVPIHQQHNSHIPPHAHTLYRYISNTIRTFHRTPTHFTDTSATQFAHSTARPHTVPIHQQHKSLNIYRSENRNIRQR